MTARDLARAYVRVARRTPGKRDGRRGHDCECGARKRPGARACAECRRSDSAAGKVLMAISSGSVSLRDIAGEIMMSERHTLRVLQKLVAEGAIKRRWVPGDCAHWTLT